MFYHYVAINSWNKISLRCVISFFTRILIIKGFGTNVVNGFDVFCRSFLMCDCYLCNVYNLQLDQTQLYLYNIFPKFSFYAK